MNGNVPKDRHLCVDKGFLAGVENSRVQIASGSSPSSGLSR